MPTYEFRCPDGHAFDKFYRSISASEMEVPCPTCGKSASRQISGGAGLQFKGSGFYLTDYGKNAHRGGSAPAKGGESSGASSGGDAAGGGSSGGSASGGDAKPKADGGTKPSSGTGGGGSGSGSGGGSTGGSSGGSGGGSGGGSSAKGGGE
jgi:putative FmdB family regulatory protein